MLISIVSLHSSSGKSSNGQALRSAAGFGIGIVPELPVLDDLDIEKLDIVDANMYREFYLVTSNIKPKTPILENFVEFVGKRVLKG